MKILLVSYYPLPFTGGIWTFVRNLKKGLLSLGHSVDILSMNPEGQVYRLHGGISGPEIRSSAHLFEGKHTLCKNDLQWNDWLQHAELHQYSLKITCKQVKLEDYDIIHAQDVFAAKVISLVKPKDVPLVTSAHGFLSREIFHYLNETYPFESDEEVFSSIIYKYHHDLENRGFHCSDYIHSQCKWTTNKIQNEFGISASKLITFPYGLDQATMKKEVYQPSIIVKKTNKKVILFTGRLVELKGNHLVLEALGKLRERRADWEFWVVGDGPQLDLLIQQSDKLGINKNVKFFGEVNYVSRLLRYADIFVLFGLQDTQPHSVMEAQMSGLPVIVSNAAGLPEMVINGENGLVAPLDNLQTLVDQFDYLLEHEFIRKKMSAHALEWARKQWSLEKMVINFVDLYERCRKK